MVYSIKKNQNDAENLCKDNDYSKTKKFFIRDIKSAHIFFINFAEMFNKKNVS